MTPESITTKKKSEEPIDTNSSVHDLLINSLKHETQEDLNKLRIKVKENKKEVDKNNPEKTQAAIELAQKCLDKLKTSQLLMLEEIFPGTLLQLFTVEQEGGIRQIIFNDDQKHDIDFGDIYNAEVRKQEKAQFIIVWDEKNVPQIGQIGLCRTEGQNRIGFSNLGINDIEKKYIKAFDGMRFIIFEDQHSVQKYLEDENINYEEDIFKNAKSQKTTDKILQSEARFKARHLEKSLIWENSAEIGKSLYITLIEILKDKTTIPMQITTLKNFLNNKNELTNDQKILLRKLIQNAEQYKKNIPEEFKGIDLGKKNISEIIRQVAIKKYEFSKIEANYIAKQIDYESKGYNIFIFSESGSGAFGIGQLMENTANGLDINRYNPLENINGILRILSEEKEKFKSFPLAMLAYNAGGSNIKNALTHNKPKNINSFKSVRNWAIANPNLPNNTQSYLYEILKNE